MEPFDHYPTDVDPRCLRGQACRTGYGAQFQRLTGQTNCAYCGLDLTDSYEHWLLLSLDHVLPQRLIRTRGEAWREWVDSLHNLVLSCLHCNTFLNGFRLQGDPPAPASFKSFCQLRDAEFVRRKQWVLERHAREQREYGKQPWVAQ
jgi:hypothetical protein